MDRRIFLHIGLHKTGTTFLQQEVFPKWKGLAFIYYQPLNEIVRIMGEGSVIISNEALHGSPWYRWGLETLPPGENRRICMGNLSGFCPDGWVMISFRKHLKLILSLYKQYLHQGGYAPFEEFFDIENNRGLIKREHFMFSEIVGDIKRNFSNPVFIFTQEEMNKGLDSLLNDMERFMGGKAPRMEGRSQKRRNMGVGHYQSKLLKALNKVTKSYLNPSGPLNLINWFTLGIGIDPRGLCQNRLAFLSKRPLRAAPEIEQKITEYYREDWAWLMTELKGREKMLDSLAKENPPVPYNVQGR